MLTKLFTLTATKFKSVLEKGKNSFTQKKSGLSQTGDDLELIFLPKNILMNF